MYLLDTCTLSHYFGGTESVVNRVNAVRADIRICVVGVQETLDGWLSQINRTPQDSPKLIDYYRKLEIVVRELNQYVVLPLDQEPLELFRKFPAEAKKVSANDRRVAAIVIRNDAILVTENLKDFRKLLPEEKLQDWTRAEQ
ncbi:MAG: hypothetical protein OHK0029_22620 [Armatimonadaceae bacterium]